MMGSSLLCIPWALGEAGFVLGIALLVVMAFICCYTAYRIVRSVDGVVKTSDAVWEFSDVCHYYFGRLGLYVSIIFSVSALLGAAMAYWVLMSNFLYHTVKFAYDPAESNSTGYHSIFLEVWQQNFTVPLSLAVLLFPLINFKSPTFFTKFNSLGTISVMYILVFVTVKAIGWGLHIDFDSASPLTSVPLTNLTFPALTGLLSLSYFLHNGILSIMHNQKHPENNGRDLCISYGLVALTYMWIGVAFYSTFPLQKDCIESNLLDNFPSADIMAIIARLLLLFQLVTIYPLLLYIMRVQLMNAMFGKSWPGLKYIIVLNLAIVCLCVLCAVFFPQIGTIIRFSGAFSGLAYIFTLPCLVYMVYSWRSGTLTWKIVFIHTFIIAFGVANFIGQFVILKL
ncbi:sodium-coupled neutral amino acid transporter 9 homolog [Ptychodera flava]|uniref:sodium-coupled neutral amino acid transporter 9 homolog n=1 Tax=Ptychodera flava TaxID=63121 RepID=UPI00396A5549